LSNTEKFLYLLGQLDDRAKRIIDNLPITDENYIIAIDMLSSRFGDVNLTVNALMSDLSRLPNPNTERVDLT
jgi:Protein of unknown function (DUF1759).